MKTSPIFVRANETFYRKLKKYADAGEERFDKSESRKDYKHPAQKKRQTSRAFLFIESVPFTRPDREGTTGRGTLCSSHLPEIKKRAPRTAVYESRSDTHERGYIFVSMLNDSYGTSL